MVKAKQKLQTEYKSRINNVFTYIDDNLNADLSLHKLASIALYSPFHFHRVFKYVTKETVNEYVTRRRIEKCALELIHKEDTVSEISSKYGFNDNSSFTRIFKKYYQVSPTEFRTQNPHEFSKIRQLESKNGQVYPDNEKYLCIIDNLKKWLKMNATIEIKQALELNLAGVTHIGLHNVEQSFDKLIKWAAPKGLMANPEAKLGRVFYDSAKVTAPDKVRMSIFLKTNESYEVSGEIYDLKINGGKCIVGRYEITPMEFEKSWTGLFVWMNENGYKKSEENPYEIYHNDYREHPEGRFIVDLYIPVE